MVGRKKKPSMAAIVYSTNNEPLTQMAVDFLRLTSCKQCTDIVVVDNGTPEPFKEMGDLDIRYEHNIGGNAVFHRWQYDDWFEGDPPDYLAFLHCDMMIHEVGWDKRIMAAFEKDPLLSLIGFVGSNEVDEYGGRGGGTILNYAGRTYKDIGTASKAEEHGRRVTGMEPVAVLDHCAMIFRRTALERLTEQEDNFAPFHFYDKIMCLEVLEQGGRVAVMGISCDHFSGGTGPGAVQADELMRTWLDENGVYYDPQRPDVAIYVESEKRFKNRFFANHFAPLKVLPDYSIVRPPYDA